MTKYYTRACNFYHGTQAKILLKKKLALPLCGNKKIVFDKIEFITRKNKKITNRFINLRNIKNLKAKEQKIIKKDLKKIISKRRNFLKNVNFQNPSIMGILNLTPDSFSDGGKFNTKKKSLIQLKKIIKSGADIVDVGGESTRPGSKTINPLIEWKRIQSVVKYFKKKYKRNSLSIDTRKSEIMEKGIKFGADLINDVSGFEYDKKSLKILRKNQISKVLHHMQGTPSTMQKNPKYKNV